MQHFAQTDISVEVNKVATKIWQINHQIIQFIMYMFIESPLLVIFNEDFIKIIVLVEQYLQ